MVLDRKRTIKWLRRCIIVLVVLTVILFVLGLYGLIRGLVDAVSGDSFGLELDKDDPSGDWTLTFNANPKNNGIMDVKLFIDLGIRNSSGTYIVRNSTSVYIPPGGQKSFSLVMTIPYAEVQRYNLTDEHMGADVTFEMTFGIRTMADLIGFTQTMRIAGDAEL
jgi:hypothetical protein